MQGSAGSRRSTLGALQHIADPSLVYSDAAQRSTTLNNLRMLACEVIARRAVSLIEYRFLAEVEQQHDAIAGGEEEPARGPTAFGREAAHLCLTKRVSVAPQCRSIKCSQRSAVQDARR